VTGHTTSMEEAKLRLVPGTVVVFEGLNRAGKSTQLSRIVAGVGAGSTAVAHMPSGLLSDAVDDDDGVH
jgi:dTMP kinase